MTQTHTPGPWDVTGQSLGGKYITVKATRDSTTICRVTFSNENDPFPCDASNARLIAAAPDMLAALQAIAALPDNQSGDRGPIKHARHIAKCAIAKATR